MKLIAKPLPAKQLSEGSAESFYLTAADLFAGAGGFSRGALDIGIDVRTAVEIDKHACATYRHNLVIGRAVAPKLFEADIRDLNLPDLRSCFPRDVKCDIVMGGPPCQGFSVHRIKNAGVSDPRNELIHRYFDIVAELRPKIFILENVPGILWERHAKYLELFYKSAKTAGYQMLAPALLDARDYGVPQRRKRVFIVGVTNEITATLDWPPKPTHGNPEKIEKNSPLLPWVPSRIAFRKAKEGDENNVHMRHASELVEAFHNTPSDGGSRRQSGRLLKCHVDHDGHKDVYGRIDRRVPAPTMTTACINPSKGRFVHPTQHHGITARQAARLQTFPDEFVFKGGLIASGKQIGNAVPVLLARAVLAHIATFLLKHSRAHE
jgi:DNA (cytosine-5)-methyltransferase 1